MKHNKFEESLLLIKDKRKVKVTLLLIKDKQKVKVTLLLIKDKRKVKVTLLLIKDKRKVKVTLLLIKDKRKVKVTLFVLIISTLSLNHFQSDSLISTVTQSHPHLFSSMLVGISPTSIRNYCIFLPSNFSK